jgi:hypothetical protein
MARILVFIEPAARLVTIELGGLQLERDFAIIAEFERWKCFINEPNNN